MQIVRSVHFSYLKSAVWNVIINQALHPLTHVQCNGFKTSNGLEFVLEQSSIEQVFKQHGSEQDKT